ncbi:hypothetical protein ACIBI8_01760 [Streptomyces sp. NPDC050529]|uniref:hypothetical protein n=1 Tax=unclassified Streptomyces TaxID=2593676 RepID=UPI002DD846B3|nr:hypothetical protein [Streptomyces sp. NBC_01022]WRZ83949.1 hypothetical protein OG316_28705 [Streptomyces sp. NBC_01022]
MAVAGWGVTQWLGEPVATSGPGPVVPPASGAEPGPQPEFDCAAAVRAAKRSQSPTPDTSVTGYLTKDSVVRADGQARLSQVVCDYAEYGGRD